MYNHSVLKCSAGCSIGARDYPFYYPINNDSVYADRYGRPSNIRGSGNVAWIPPEENNVAMQIRNADESPAGAPRLGI